MTQEAPVDFVGFGITVGLFMAFLEGIRGFIIPTDRYFRGNRIDHPDMRDRTTSGIRHAIVGGIQGAAYGEILAVTAYLF